MIETFRCLNVSKYMKKRLVWNFAISFMFSQFTPIVLPCLINLQNVRLALYYLDVLQVSKGTIIERMSDYLAYVLISISSVSIILFCYLIKKHSGSESISFLYENLKSSDSLMVRYWRPIWLSRWLLTLVILVIFQWNFIIQIITLFILSVTF